MNRKPNNSINNNKKGISNERISTMLGYLDRIHENTTNSRVRTELLDVESIYGPAKGISNMMESFARKEGMTLSEIKAIDLKHGKMILRKKKD